MLKTVDTTAFSEEQKERFTYAFYRASWRTLGSLLRVMSDDFAWDADTPAPWGCPWLWCEEIDATGHTVEELAEDFFRRSMPEIEEAVRETLDARAAADEDEDE